MNYSLAEISYFFDIDSVDTFTGVAGTFAVTIGVSGTLTIEILVLILRLLRYWYWYCCWQWWNIGHFSASRVPKFWHASQLIIRWGWRWRWKKMMIWMQLGKFVTRTITSYNWASKFSSPYHYGPHLNLATFLQQPPIYLRYNLISQINHSKIVPSLIRRFSHHFLTG